jgi:hypothetical protein
MSALPQKADLCSALTHVRFGPKADITLSAFKSIKRTYCNPAFRMPSINLTISAAAKSSNQIRAGRGLYRSPNCLRLLRGFAGQEYTTELTRRYKSIYWCEVILELRDIDQSVNDAITELREQQELVARVDYPQNHYAMLALLSNGLRQFRWLERQRKNLLEWLSPLQR